MIKKAGMMMLAAFLLAGFAINSEAARPTVKITAAPTTIIIGSSSTLTWTSTGATSASINQGIGSVAVNGSRVVTPTATTTYTITAKNSSGNTTATAKITVKAAPPTVTFSASPATIPPGGSATLSWTTTNATSASINQNIGTVALNGSKTVAPTATKTYTITVIGSGGTLTAQATVTVKPTPPTVTFSAEPATIQPGELSTLIWTSTNATSATIDNDIGTVDLNGSIEVFPEITTIYTIIVSGSGGTASASATVTVIQPQPQVNLKAIPTAILPGESTTLCWQTTNVDSTNIDNGVGAVPANGSVVVSPTATTTYTITASGPGGTANAAVTVSIDGTLQPSVSIYSSLEIVASGGEIVLSWNAAHAESANIDNGIGSVSSKGSLRVTPVQSTTYTITAENSNGTATASVKVELKSSPRCYAYIPEYNSNIVTIVDNDHNQVLKTIAIGGYPNDCAVARDGMRVYIGSSQGISIIDTGANAVVSTINIGMNPEYLALHPGGKILCATGYDESGVVIAMIDTETGQVVRTLHLNDQNDDLHGITFHPDGSKLYTVIAQGGGSGKILVIDTASNEIMSNIPLLMDWDSASDLVMSPDGSRLYLIRNSYDDGYFENLFVIDTATNTVLKKVTIYCQYAGKQDRLLKMAILPDGSRLYVIAYEENSGKTVFCMDTTTFAVSQVNDVVSYPKSLAVHPNGSRLFVLDEYALYSFHTSDNSSDRLVGLSNGHMAYGNFTGYMADTVSGKVTQNNVGVEGVTLTISGLGFTKTVLTDANGNYIMALKNGTYTITPSKENMVFSPLSRQVTVNQSVSGKDFKVIDTSVAPTVTLSASPVTINIGGSATLTWISTNAVMVTIDNDIGEMPESGSISVTPSTTTTYKITVSNTVLTASATVIVYVYGSVPTVSISAAPVTINSGESSTLTWTSTSAASAAIDNNIGTVPVNGSIVVNPAATTTYKITVTGPGGTANASVPVTVNNPYNSVLTGTVTDFSSGQPIAGVLVTALDSASQSKTTQTDAAGEYTISSLAPGNVQVSFAKSGYDPYQQTINIPANTTFELITKLRLTLVGATLTGLVKDGQTGQPVAGATVTAVFAGGGPLTCTSLADGSYFLTGLPLNTNIQVTAAKTGFYSITINQSFTMNAVFVYDFIFSNTATLQGLVKDGQTSQPIVGATVTATFTGGSLTSTSGSDGAYSIVGIPLNTPVIITASAAGYRNFIINQTFTPNAWLIYDFILYNASVLATVNGKITNSKTLSPEAGVKVTHEGSNVSQTTAADGTFIFDNIPLGEQTFYLEKTDFLDEFMTFIIDSTPFTIDLIKPGNDGGEIKIGQSVSGVIRDSISQRPIAGAKVRVPSLHLEVLTDADGNYSLTGLLIGTYPVIALAVNHQSINFMATVASGATNKVDFVLVPIAKGLLTGKITDAATGEAVADACIDIEGSSFLADASEGDGTYKMVGVPPGLYKVVFTHADYNQAIAENVEVFELSPTTVDIQLNKRPQTGALEGIVSDINTGNPVSGATVVVPGTAISATTDAAGKYRLTNVPAGLNDITVSASGYPESPRIRAVIADETPTSSSTTVSNIPIDPASSTVNEAVTQLIRANEGGDIISRDSRFVLHIFPDTLSADANITLNGATNGSSIALGDDLPLDPALEITGIKAASVMMKIQVAAVNDIDPAPTINGLAAVAMRYSQKDVDDFQLDENTAFPYFLNGTLFSALNPRPYELAVDKTNNIAYAVMDFSKTVNGDAAPFLQLSSLRSGSLQGVTAKEPSFWERIFVLGKGVVISALSRPNVKIFDKNELSCVTNAAPNNKPNPNALPLLCIHGFDPLDTFIALGTNPNKGDRYPLMLQDIVEATNGVYRPVFVSYNTEAKIASIGGKLAEKIFGEYLNQNNKIKGLPADPANPASGNFPFLDTFSFSMGGLVARSFRNRSTVNMVHNMVMIATPNHGTISLLKELSFLPSYWGNFIGFKILNPGAGDQLDYDDSSLAGRLQNPFLFDLNSPGNSQGVSPRGDMTLFAGNDNGAYGFFGPFLQALLASPNDSLIPVRSVFCRPTGSPPESKLSLLKVYGKGAKIKEIPPKDFSHDNIGKKDHQIKDFINEIALGLSDWTVDRMYFETPLDFDSNSFDPPSYEMWGHARNKVKVDYNVWVPDSERQARDIDRVVLVIYHKDGNGHWHISPPNGGENGADVHGCVNPAKVISIQGNSKDTQAGNPLILAANVFFEPNPGVKGGIGYYDPEKDIVAIKPLFIPLKPGKMTVPLDPTKADFATPY